ncbi:hypothetical protein H072_2311 [Dactylellina haptotyla CBS 200.50]|uniref:Uncharacterized protein n=1 Tax=Dactylellina haptotyla (strain CBS 200.50) TaxID=1284197 RepID=S8C7K7_DACHA|nr:hypothetical protein H072_2311 [Dactylellina haptotyla CBS 200.50]
MVDDRNSNWTGWKVDRNALEAILTLWKYDIDEDEDQPDTGYNERTQSIILLGASSEFNTLDYDIFIGNSDKCLRMEYGLEDLGTSNFPVAEHRVFGYLGSDPDEEHLALVSFANILDLCARHLLTCYFYRVCQLIHNFNGQTTAFRNPDLKPTVAESILRMDNSNLDKMVDILHASGISGTPEDLLVILVPALQKNGNLLRIFDAFSKIVQEIQEAEASSLKPIISKEMLFHMAEQALKKFRNSNHWLHAGDFVFGLLETCQRLLGPNHPCTLTARALASRACFSIETQIFCKLELQDIQEKKPLAEICRSLALHAERVLGEDSDECKLLWRLRAKASFTESQYSIAAAEAVELPPTHVFGPGMAFPLNLKFVFSYSNKQLVPQSRPTTATSRRLSNASTRSRLSRALSPTNFFYERSSDPTVRAIQLQRPRLDFRFVKTFPPALWVHMQAQNLVALYDMLTPPDGSPLTPDETILVSNTFIIAAGCGYPKVVELCLTRFQDICCYSVVGIGVSFSKAVNLATMNNDETILDLILSSLDHDQMISLEAVGASDNLNCLQLACRDGATAIAHLLLRAGMNAKGPPDTSNFRQLPIYLAAKGNYTDIISLLMFYGVPANYQEFENGNTFLHYAAENQAKETIKFALSSEFTMLPVFFTPNYEGNNVLDIAILLGHDSTAIRILNAMIEYSDQPDWELDLRTHINKKGQTALHLACICNRPEIVRILLDKGFTPERKGLEEFSAYETAAMYGPCEVGKVLLGFNPRSTISKLDDDGWWPILLAVHNDRTDYVRFLLDNGADIETTDRNTNSTPISVAVCRDNSALVEILMAREANLMVQDHDGQNLFHLAAISDSTGCLDCLFRTSNNQIYQLIGQLNSAHATPLQTALLHGSLAAAGNILKHIRSLDIIGQPMANGMNAVHLICSFLTFSVDHLGVVVVRYFLNDYIKDIGPLPEPPSDILNASEKLWGEHAEPGAIDLLETILGDGTIDVNDTDNLGYTPLFYAAASGSLGVCSLLLERMGPHYDRILLEKPMHVALYTGDIDIIKLFLRAGINPNEPFQHSDQSLIAHLLRIAARTRGKVDAITTLLPDVEDYDDIGPWESDVQLLDCLQLFLDAGASLDPSEEQLRAKSSLLHLAILSKSPEVFSQLVNSGANPTFDVTLTPPLLHFALAAGSDNINLIPLFCRLGIDINAVDRDGKSALTIEIGERKLATVMVLLENGAVLKTDGPIPDMILAMRKGGYPVFKAICHHHKYKAYKGIFPTESDYISFLNTSLSIPNVPSCTAVHAAAGLGYNDILGFLRDEGADMDGKDANGHNALSYALVQQPTMIWLITDCGIDPNERLTTEGYTTAHLAVSSIEEVGRVIEALQCLWRLGADFNIEDNSGRLPSDYIDLGNAAWTKIPEAKGKVRRLFARCESPDGRYVLFDESYEAMHKAQGVITIAESLATPIGYQGNRISSSSIDFQV